MSGAAGGSRINKENLKATIRDYRENILKPLGLDKSYSITGVRSRPEKNVFGDIDIVISFPEGDKKEVKQELAKFLSQSNNIPTIPHKDNKKYFIHGNIVSILYPISGKEGEYVQIDNIVTISKEEGKFTYKMLDLPAQEQVLAIGLVKAVFSELDKKQIENLFKELGINNTETPGENEEYDFNLNPSGLSLRIVPIGKNEGREIWKSNNFDDIKTITKYLGIDIENDKFDTIISKVKKFKNRRSIDRLKGMFKKNIRIGDTEAGTEKGIKKQQALDAISALEEKYNSFIMELIKPLISEEETKKTIAIFPGKFKPPHKDHIARIKAAAEDADEVIVLVSPKTEPSGTTKKDKEKLTNQMPISVEDSLNIFKLAKLPSNVKVIQSPTASPVTAAYEIFKNNPNQQYIAVFGKEEDFTRFGKIPSNVIIKNYNEAAGNLSATDLRIALKNNKDITPFLPDGISSEEYKQALSMNVNEMSQSSLQSIEDYADRELAPLDIDFSNHFFDRLNDPRNIKPISTAELIGFFKRLSRKKDQLEYFLKKYKEVVASDNRTNINIPLVDLTDKIIAKTIMRKKNFYTADPKIELNEDCGCQQPNNFKQALVSLIKYMLDQDLNISPLPKLKIINNDSENAKNILGKTAHYDPNDCSITLYTLDRHPKDILRSFSHEMIHRIQDNEGRLNNINTTNTNEDGNLQELEKEAYLNGNMIFRNWEDSIKNQKYIKEYKQYVLKELFEKDLPNIEKLNNLEYLVGNGDDIEALYYFNLEDPKGNWSIHWKFTDNNKNTSPEAWKQITASSYKILDNFIKSRHPRSITISGNTDTKTKIYKSKSYLEKLENIFNNEYKIDNSPEYSVIMKSIEETAKSNIQKRMITLNESYEQALNYWQNGDLNSNSKIERWNTIKRKVKREVLQELYNIK